MRPRQGSGSNNEFNQGLRSPHGDLSASRSLSRSRLTDAILRRSLLKSQTEEGEAKRDGKTTYVATYRSTPARIQARSSEEPDYRGQTYKEL